MKTLITILLTGLATSVAVPQTSPTKSEINDAANSAKAFIEIMVKFRQAQDWTPLVDDLERAAKQYVGKSKIQIAAFDSDRELRNAPAEVKTKASLFVVKLDAAAAQAIRFTQAYRRSLAAFLAPGNDEYAVACANQAETERLKFISATKEMAAAGIDFAK